MLGDSLRGRLSPLCRIRALSRRLRPIVARSPSESSLLCAACDPIAPAGRPAAAASRQKDLGRDPGAALDDGPALVDGPAAQPFQGLLGGRQVEPLPEQLPPDLC